MRKAEWILISLVIPLGEVHKLWRNINYEVDVFLFRDYKIDVEWMVKDCSEMAQFSIVAYIAYRLGRYAKVEMAIIKILLALFLYSILDFVLYFMDHKTSLYGIVFYVIAYFVIFYNHLFKR